MDLNSKIAEAMQERFIGNYVFSEEELAQLYADVGSLLRTASENWGSTLSSLYDEKIFVALVNMAKEWNSDEDGFFEYVFRRILGTETSGKIYNHIIAIITRLSSKGRIIAISSYKKKYYATIICHAFAPQKSVESFFDLCWKIYCDDLEQECEKDDPVFDLLAEQLKNKFKNEVNAEDEIKLGSEIYALRAGIKGLAMDFPEHMKDFLFDTIDTIQKCFNGEALDKTRYLTSLIENWWHKKEQVFGIHPRPKNPQREITVSDYSSIRPKYVLQDNVARLFVPAIRLMDHFDTAPYLTVYSGGKEILSEELPLRGSGLLMATKSRSYEIDQLLSGNDTIDISLEISQGASPIYNSKESLKRDFILFRDEKEVFAQDCLPGNYCIFAPNFDSVVAQYPQNTRRIGNHLYTCNAENGEVLQSNSRSVFFVNEKQKRDLWLFAEKRNDVVFRYQNEDYSVVDGDLKVVVQAGINIHEYGIRYEETSFRLADFSHIESEQTITYSVTELLQVGEPQKITIFRYSDNRIISQISVVKFKNIRVGFDKEIYFDEQSGGTVSFVTEKYNISSSFHISQAEILLPIENGAVVVQPPVFRWRIDDGEWNHGYCEEGLWYKNFSNSSLMFLDVPRHINGTLYFSNGKEIQRKSTDEWCFEIGQTAWSMVHNQSEPLEILFRTIDGELLPIGRLYFKETFRSEPFYVFQERSILWSPEKSYIGGKSDKFVFELHKAETVAFSRELSLAQDCFLCYPVKDGFYTGVIKIKSIGFLSHERELFRQDICLGNEKELRFQDKTLLIDKVMLMGRTSPTDIRPFSIDHIHYIPSESDTDFYSGSVFINTLNGRKVYLNSMPDDSGTPCQVNPVRIEMMNARACWIVNGFGGTLDDFQAEFTLNEKGQISNCDRNTKGIDYYFFKEV